jgi:hypothetical protein
MWQKRFKLQLTSGKVRFKYLVDYWKKEFEIYIEEVRKASKRKED